MGVLILVCRSCGNVIAVYVWMLRVPPRGLRVGGKTEVHRGFQDRSFTPVFPDHCPYCGARLQPPRAEDLNVYPLREDLIIPPDSINNMDPGGHQGLPRGTSKIASSVVFPNVSGSPGGVETNARGTSTGEVASGG